MSPMGCEPSEPAKTFMVPGTRSFPPVSVITMMVLRTRSSNPFPSVQLLSELSRNRFEVHEIAKASSGTLSHLILPTA